MSDSKSSLLNSTGLSRILRRAAGFRREEGGAMIVFGLTIFVMMLWIGGMAVDFMRFEHDRARVQYTLDRAALAAASLNQPLDCEAVARDYFDKSGLDTTKVEVEGECSLLSKTVTVNADTEVKSFFINLLGIETMTASGTSTAEENVQDVEISLVLDVSGSMGWDDASGDQTKLEALKTAAGEFIDAMLIEDNEDRVSINIIPYNMQVNAGEDVLDQLNVTDEHDYSHCIDFDAADFETAEISKDVADGASLGDISLDGSTVMGSIDDLQRTGHFDPFYTEIRHANDYPDGKELPLYNCPITESSEIMLMSQDATLLKAKVNSLTAGGNTSIDIGVKWGSFFLNPNAEPLLDALPDDSSQLTGPIDAAFADRPYEYDRENTIKIMVVMTDGQNTTQYMLDDDFNDDSDTDVWLDPDSTWMSHWQSRPGPNNNYLITYGDRFQDYFSGNRRNPSDDSEMNWQELWDMMGVKWYAYYLKYVRDYDADEYYDTLDDVLDYVYAAEKDNRLSDACQAAKDNDVVVYTIGFEVSDTSADVMEDCASTSSDFFRVEGTEISDAFGSIAKTIQRLKLTQ